MNIEVNIEEKEPKYLYRQCKTCKAVDTCMYRELFKEIEEKFKKEFRKCEKSTITSRRKIF